MEFFVFTDLYAQIRDRYPADVAPSVGIPYSLFLEDYYDDVKQLLSANILFNDFNESSWTFKIRLRMESSDIKITNTPGFTPSIPIIVNPGALYHLTGSEWTEYFDPVNQIFEGPGANTIEKLGRLPEGFYTIYVQVLDYDTGEALSQENSVSFWVGLQNPPLIISPTSGEMIGTKTSQINFSWQQFNLQSPNIDHSLQYTLRIWELTDDLADPMNALSNGQALPVFESEPLITTSYLYGLSDPILETGKSYIFQVQVQDVRRRDVFKNQGKSEFHHFYFGFPTGNTIELVYPEQNGGFRKNVSRTLQWKPIENRVPGQWVDYQIQVAELEEEEDPELALFDVDYSTNLFTDRNYDLGIRIDDFNIKPKTKYVWQVIGFSDEIEVGRSPPGIFHGPPLFENIYAGRHRIEVDYVNGDISNLTGGGKVRLSSDSESWTDVKFENLSLTDHGGYYYIEKGEIIYEFDAPQHIAFSAEVASNPDGNFTISKARLDSQGLSVYGHFSVNIPFPIFSTEEMGIKSEEQWIGYDYFIVFGSLDFMRDYSFLLLEPYNYQLTLYQSSSFFFDTDTYRLSVDGNLGLPEKIKDFDPTRSAQLPFFNQEQIDYLNNDDALNISPLKVVPNTQIRLIPLSYTIDLSDAKSPTFSGHHENWKGTVFNEFMISFPEEVDDRLQYKHGDFVQESVTFGDSIFAYMDSKGLTASYVRDFSSSEFGTFNSFPASANHLRVEIIDNSVTRDSRFSGSIKIPLLSETESFDFIIPVSDYGFEQGTMTDLVGKQYSHNPGNLDQAILIDVKRAVFEDMNRLSITADMSWPSLDLVMELVGGLKIWGNYNLGFHTPEGSIALDYQVNAKIGEYPITVDAISAGRSQGHYGFGISGKVLLGEDVSGNEGAPSFNMYSIVKNDLLPGTYKPESKLYNNIQVADSENTVETLREEMSQLETDLLQNLDNISQRLLSEIDGTIDQAAIRIDGRQVGINDMYEVDSTSIKSGFSIADGKDIRSQINALLDFADPVVGKPTTAKGKTILAGIENDELADLSSKGLFDLNNYMHEFASNALGNELVKLSNPLTSTIGKLNNQLVGEVRILTENVNSDVGVVISDIVDETASEIASSLSSQSPEADGVIHKVAESVKRALILETEGTLYQAVNDNITFPITDLLQNQIQLRIEAYLMNSAKKAVITAFNGNNSPQKSFAVSSNDFENELDAIGEEVVTFLNPENVAFKIRSLASDAISNIDGNRIVMRIKQGAADAMVDYIAKKTSSEVAKIVNRELEDDIGIESPLNIGTAISKLVAGGNFKDVLSDPVIVKVRSSALDLNGEVFFTEDHPLYGDVWSGAVDVLVKVPKPFTVQAAYLNGREENTPFWLAEIGGSAASVVNTSNGAPDGVENIGGKMERAMEVPPGGVKMGIAEIMGIRGRVFHHMKPDALNDIVPDPQQRLGAYFHMVLFGPKNGDQLRMELEAEVNTFKTGDLTVSFFGGIQMDNVNPKVLEVDPDAAIQGEIELKYNSFESHFFGYAAVRLRKLALCAEGSLLVDVKPGAWRIALGTREQRLGFVPACAGPAYYGWLDLNQSTAELGLGLGLAFYLSTGINLKIARLAVVVDAGINVNAFVVAQYKPLTINEVGVFVEMWARLLIAYKMAVKSGEIELLDTYLYASAILRFNPSPSALYGELKGHVRVLRILKFDFEKNFELEV